MNTVLLIVNPVSGKKIAKKILPTVVSELEKNKFRINIMESEYKGHIEKILNTYSIENYYYCCIIGGDGSFHEAINGLMKRLDSLKIPLCLIPAGSGNSLARDLGILDLKIAISSIINGKKLSIDIARIDYDNQTIYSFNITGWGMVATIGINAERFRWLGTSRYTILSIFEIIFKKTNTANIIYYDQDKKKHEIDNNFIFAVLCNTVHTGKGMKIAPKAKLNDGLIDLVLIKDTSRLKLFRLMSKLFSGQHIYDDIVEYSHISKFKLKTNIKSQLNIDGEIKGSTPFKLTVIPNAIKIIN
tara:strand:+ start:237 stop:1139 length:903 start_codon:yes stop_codon:yes gene_type:complete